MAPPRIVELPSYHVARLRYEGPPPPAPALIEHWRRFHELAAELPEPPGDVIAIGYAPPGPPGSATVTFDTCLPLPDDAPPPPRPFELGLVPSGRYVLASGEVAQLPRLLHEAKRLAISRGLAVERGWIECYHRSARPDEQPVDAGYRIHD